MMPRNFSQHSDGGRHAEHAEQAPPRRPCPAFYPSCPSLASKGLGSEIEFICCHSALLLWQRVAAKPGRLAVISRPANPPKDLHPHCANACRPDPRGEAEVVLIATTPFELSSDFDSSRCRSRLSTPCAGQSDSQASAREATTECGSCGVPVSCSPSTAFSCLALLFASSES